jgi:lysine biosynthesis protein LysW
MQATNKTNVAICPDCEMEIKVGESPKLDEKILCPHCGAFLRVINLVPLELDWDLDDFDDWDSDDFDDWNNDDDW